MEGSSAFQSLRCVITVYMKACVSLVCCESSLLHRYYTWMISHLRTQAYSDIHGVEIVASLRCLDQSPVGIRQAESKVCQDPQQL